MACAPCLQLLDLPVVALQIIVHRLPTADAANLRLASRHISKAATQHIPYVSMRLCPSSNPDYPALWCQATKRLQHVSSIHIHISSHTSLKLFDSAIQALSQRSYIKELQLIGVQSNSSSAASSAAFIPSLLPLVHLAGELGALTIQNLTIQNTVSSMQELAEQSAGQWQLQGLTLAAGWFGSECTSAAELFSALSSLTVTFPYLQQLHLSVPPLPLGSKGLDHVELRAVVYIVAVALQQAIKQLRHLELLTVSGLPDLWMDQVTAMTPTLASATTARASLAGASTAAQPAAEAASGDQKVVAAALRSMDSLGCWLLQQQPNLRQLEMTCGKWAMSWQNQRHNQMQSFDERCASSAASATDAASVAGPTSVGASYHCPKISSRSSGSSSCSFQDVFLQHVSQYSFRSASDLLQHITACQLTLNAHQARDSSLAALLKAMKSLQECKISLLITSYHDGSATASVSAVVAAAAGVPRLKSLDLLTGWSEIQVTPDILLPLTAAAGGPGISLEKLQLKGRFASAPTTAAAVGVCSESGWSVLKQLNGLRELKVHQLGPECVDFPIGCLPANLEVFKGHRLNLEPGESPAAATAVKAASNDQLAVHAADEQAAGGTKTAQGALRLRVLELQLCRVCDVSTFAGKQLEELTVGSSNLVWPEGWSADAVKWPLLRKLVVWFDKESGGYAGSSKSRTPGTAAAVARFLRDISVAFSALRCLTIQYLPHLAVADLQPVVDNLTQLRYVFNNSTKV